MAPNRIVELVSIIHDNTIKVDAYLASESLPTPSFDISYPAHLPRISKLPKKPFSRPQTSSQFLRYVCPVLL